MQPASQVLTTVVTSVLVVILAVTSVQFLRVAVTTIFGVLRQLIRTLLYVTSWPIYLGLLPVRALIFLTSFSVKVMFYGGIAAILYLLLYGGLKLETIEQVYGAVLQFL